MKNELNLLYNKSVLIAERERAESIIKFGPVPNFSTLLLERERKELYTLFFQQVFSIYPAKEIEKVGAGCSIIIILLLFYSRHTVL